MGSIRIPVLLSDGGQDAVWDSAGSAKAIIQELQAANDPAPYANLYYPGAGHAAAGSAPYFPYSDIGSHGNEHGGKRASQRAGR